MKAGDLVELSAIGKKLRRNTRHADGSALGKIGLVVRAVIDAPAPEQVSAEYCVAMHVRWLGDYMSMRTDWHRRDELKHAK